MIGGTWDEMKMQGPSWDLKKQFPLLRGQPWNPLLMVTSKGLKTSPLGTHGTWLQMGKEASQITHRSSSRQAAKVGSPILALSRPPTASAWPADPTQYAQWRPWSSQGNREKGPSQAHKLISVPSREGRNPSQGSSRGQEGGKRLDLTRARVHVLNVFSEFKKKKIGKIIKNVKMMATEHYTPKQGGPLREGTWVAGCSLEKHNLFIELSHFCFSKMFEYILCLLWCLFVYGFPRRFRIILFKRKKKKKIWYFLLRMLSGSPSSLFLYS